MTLSSREAEILALVASGLTSAAIAAALGLSVRTVNQHVERTMKRMGARNRMDAVISALTSGQIYLNGIAGVSARKDTAAS